MQIDGNLDIKIIQGDSYRREITIEGIMPELIEGVYFTSADLQICKKCEFVNGIYILEFTPQETSDFKSIYSSYDITIKFTQNKVNTICYNASLIVLPKENKVGCYGKN